MRRSWIVLVAVVGFMPALADDAGKDASGLRIDQAARTVTIDCKVAPRKIDDPKLQGVIYPIEVIATWPYPKGQKAHETVVTTTLKPSKVHEALEALGLKPGKPVKGDSPARAEGPEVRLLLQFDGPDGTPRKVPVERTLVDAKTNKPMPRVKWHFTGSVRTKPSPDKDETVYGADQTGTLAAIFPVTDETVFQSSLTMKEEKYVKLDTDKTLLPKEGTLVRLVIETGAKK